MELLYSKLLGASNCMMLFFLFPIFLFFFFFLISCLICRKRKKAPLISSDLRPRNQCIQAKNRANRVLGFITRSVSNRSADVILKLYLALVRPHLDYAVQFWSPYYRTDINRLESVQRRMTKMIQGLRTLPYQERLRRFKLH